MYLYDGNLILLQVFVFPNRTKLNGALITADFIIIFYSILALNVTNITVPEGKDSTLVCNVEEKQVIWMINGIPTSGNENFQPLSSNSTLIIRNSVSDGAAGGTFHVSCMGNNSRMTDERTYLVRLTKGILCFVFMSLKSSAFYLFKSNRLQDGSIGQTAVCVGGGVE